MANPKNAITPLTSANIAEGTTFTAVQVDLIRDQIMPGATDPELMLFVQVASSRGLDPFRKHIYAVSRRAKEGNNWVDKWSYQVSIDGLRLIAERTGKYEGQTLTQWCSPDGRWRDVWLDPGPPAAAKVGVYKKGAIEPLYAVALYRTYVQTKQDGSPTKFWESMPELMLAKCAESLALRKAFPEEAGGLFTNEEMGQADNFRPEGIVIDHETGVIEEPRNVRRLTPKPGEALDTLLAVAEEHGIPRDNLDGYARSKGIDRIDLVPESSLRGLSERIASKPDDAREFFGRYAPADAPIETTGELFAPDDMDALNADADRVQAAERARA